MTTDEIKVYLELKYFKRIYYRPPTTSKQIAVILYCTENKEFHFISSYRQHEIVQWEIWISEDNTCILFPSDYNPYHDDNPHFMDHSKLRNYLYEEKIYDSIDDVYQHIWQEEMKDDN